MIVRDLLKALEGITPLKNVFITFAGEDERLATTVTLGWNAVHICDTGAGMPKDETVLFGAPASSYCPACNEYMPPHAPHMCSNWPPKKDQGSQPNEQKMARIIFEQMNNCSIRDPNTTFNDGSGPLRAAQAVLAALARA